MSDVIIPLRPVTRFPTSNIHVDIQVKSGNHENTFSTNNKRCSTKYTHPNPDNNVFSELTHLSAG